MLHSLARFIEDYGYIAVALLVAAEGMGVPLPGETAVVTAAAFAGRGSLSLLGVILSATAGAVLGGTGGYALGAWGGRAALLRFGRFVGIDEVKVAQADDYFSRHGAKTVFFARFVALLRILGGLMAGAAKMPFATFSFANFAGGAVWATTFAVLGYLFGKNLPELERRLGLVSAILAGVVILGVVWFLVVRRRRRSPDDVAS